MTYSKTMTVFMLGIILSACGGGGGASTATPLTDPLTERTELCSTVAECRAVVLAGRKNRHSVDNLQSGDGTSGDGKALIDAGADTITQLRWNNYFDYTDPKATWAVDPRDLTYDALFDYRGTDVTKDGTWRRQETAYGMTQAMYNTPNRNGQGVKIGIMDPALFVTRHRDYAPRLTTGMILYHDYWDESTELWRFKWQSGYKPLWKTKSHGKDTGYAVGDTTGTHAQGIVSLAAGTQYGVAKRATIVPYSIVGLHRLYQGFQLKSVYDHMKANDVIAMNISVLSDSTATDRAAYDAGLGKDFIDAVSADADASRDGPIWVWAAGNNANNNPDFEPRAPQYIPKLERYWLAVTSVYYNGDHGNERYEIAGSSNMCGSARRWCLTAIGETASYDLSNVDGTSYSSRLTSGTSYAAPAVTGALAVLKDAFPSQNNTWIRERLLRTASHTAADGVPLRGIGGSIPVVSKRSDCISSEGCSHEFGNGIIRLDRAIPPVGGITPASVGAKRASVDTLSRKAKASVLSSPAFGDGIHKGLGQVHTKMFDGMLAPFDRPMSDYVQVYDAPNQDIKHLSKASFANTLQTPSVKVGEMALRGGYTKTKIPKTKIPFASQNALIGEYGYRPNNHVSFAVSPKTGDTKTWDSVTIQYTTTKNRHTRWAYGVYSENGSVFGTKMSGDFAQNGRTSTAYTMIQKSNVYGNWLWNFTGVFGVATISGLDGKISRLNNTSVSEWRWNATQHLDSNRIVSFSIYQPLRIESATATVHHINRVSDSTKLHWTTTDTDITPSGREISLVAQYAYKNLSFKTMYSHNKYHTHGNNSYGVFMYYDIPFKR